MKSPFKFLDYFEDKEEDHESFFGREPEIERLYRLVNHHRLSLIYGPSGTGKTSLINCGLAKQFYATDWLPLYIKRQGNINNSLLNALKGRLQEEEEQLADSEDVVKLIEELSIQHLCPVYLIFDQLEELYIYGGQEEQLRFTDQVKRIVDAGLPCRIILVLREEYLGRLYAFEQQVPISYEKRLRIEPLTAPIVKQEVIAKSFVLFNISLSEPGLMDRMLKNLTGLKQVIPLPYLQVYLDRLWNAAYREQVGEVDIEKPALAITPAIVDDLGPLEKVFADYLTDQQRAIQHSLAERFPACPEDFVRSLLDGLVTPEGTKRSVSIEREGEKITVSAPTPSGWDQVDSLLLNEGLKALADARLLRPEDTSIELAHDSLAAVIDGQRSAEERQLNLYRQQIRASFEMFPQTGDYLSKNKVPLYEESISELGISTEQRAYLEASKVYWQKIDKEELAKEREKRRRLVVFSIAALALALVALFMYNRADTALNVAESRRIEAERSDSISVVAREEARASAKRDSISRVDAELASDTANLRRIEAEKAKKDLVGEVNKGKLLENTIGGNYDELIRQGEDEFRKWHLQNALTYWADARFLRPEEKKARELVYLAERTIEAVRLVNDGYWNESEELFSAVHRSDLGTDVEKVKWFLGAIAESRINWLSVKNNVNLTTIDTLYLIGDIISIPRKESINTNLKGIVLKRNDFIQNLKSIEPFTRLTNITLINVNNILSINQLVSFIELSDLNIDLGSNSNITNLGPLSKLSSLTSLNLKLSRSITNLNPLSTLTNLAILELDFNLKSIDFSPLSKLTNLTRLNLSHYLNLTDLSPLSNLEKLTILDLSGYHSLIDLSPLSKLEKLTILDLSNNNSLTDLSPLSKLEKLTTLDLSGNNSLTDLRPLSKLNNLSELDLSYCGYITDLSPLSNLTNLTKLYLHNSFNITDLRPLSELNNLTELDLSTCEKIIDFSLLSKLTKLTYLNLGTSFKNNDLNLLINLKELTYLNLRNNGNITDLSPLSNLTNLIELDLSDNFSLVDISPITKLTALTDLDLSGNPDITNISPIANLKMLKRLVITISQIPEQQIINLKKALPSLKINP